MAGILFPRDEVKRLTPRANPEPSDADATGIAPGAIQQFMKEEAQREADTAEQMQRGIKDQMLANMAPYSIQPQFQPPTLEQLDEFIAQPPTATFAPRGTISTETNRPAGVPRTHRGRRGACQARGD